jgi:2-methylcitrate dehydratase PrpD
MLISPSPNKLDRFIQFIHNMRYDELPQKLRRKTELTLLDTCGVAAAGSKMRAAALVKRFALNNFACPDIQTKESTAIPGRARLLFDGRKISPGGAALAAGQAVDSMDAHDGHYAIKGSHVSGTLLAGMLALGDTLLLESQANGKGNTDEFLRGSDLLAAWVVGQEITVRFGYALQVMTPEVYIPSGLIGALGIVAMGTRLLRLNRSQTMHALGIAELHAPRIQSHGGWRVTICPTMLKDTVAWGAMAGTNAVLLALSGFSGAPCGLLAEPQTHQFFNTLGQEWECLNLYMKPVPCCRYAIPAVRMALQLLADERKHALLKRKDTNTLLSDIDEVRITTFKEACLLGCDVPIPQTAEEAQYHVAWPVAAALVEGEVPGPQSFSDESVANDARIHRMCSKIRVKVKDEYTQVFPERTLVDVRFVYRDGRTAELRTDQVQTGNANFEATEDAQADTLFLNLLDPDMGICTEKELLDKYRRYAGWGIGEKRTNRLQKSILALRNDGNGVGGEFLNSMLSPNE